jgi:hypothetical protein
MSVAIGLVHFYYPYIPSKEENHFIILTYPQKRRIISIILTYPQKRRIIPIILTTRVMVLLPLTWGTVLLPK